MKHLLPIGRSFFAVALIAWGIQHLVYDDFVTRVVPGWPAWLPPRAASAYLMGAVLIAIGGAMLLQWKVRTAALMFALITLLSFAFLHLPIAAADGPLGGKWTSAGKALTLFGGAIALALTAPEGKGGVGGSFQLPTWSFFLSRLCFGVFLVLAGIQHFKWAQFVKSLVPGWIPGAVFWTYFSGVALIAAGVGIIPPKTARLASLCTGLMIFAWVILLHIPRALANVKDSNETTAVFEALAFSGFAFVLATLIPKKGS